jgi:ABC-2 type transport system ATP-binding protein
MKHMLSVQGITKRFGRKTAVNNVSFAVKPGEIFALIGPNGSGKTTIVKLIAGLLRPTGGDVEVSGASVMREPVATKAAIGYIPDEPAVWAAMTGGEFLHFVGALYGVPERERISRVKKLLSAFRLGGLEQEYFEDYSRGNKQKFAILAALLHRPKLLLIDEPIVGLDPTSAELAKQEFSAFAKRGGAVLIVTHTLPVAEEIASRIGILKDGVLVAQGTMAELRRKARLAPKATLEAVYRKFAAR